MSDVLRYEPFRKLDREINRLFGGWPRLFDEESAAVCAWYPRMDINERKDEIVVRFDLPGMKQSDIKVTVENNVLTISGERKFEKDEKKDNFHRVECSYGSFTRSLSLPQTVNTEKIEANYRDGVLELTMPKREESKPKQISVKIG